MEACPNSAPTALPAVEVPVEPAPPRTALAARSMAVPAALQSAMLFYLLLMMDHSARKNRSWLLLLLLLLSFDFNTSVCWIRFPLLCRLNFLVRDEL